MLLGSVSTGTVLMAVMSYVEYAIKNSAGLAKLTVEHIDIIALAIGIAVPIGVTLGVLISFDDRAATVVIWLAGIMMTIPSIALFGLLIPLVGIGNPPVIVALVLYSQLPIIRNTYVGLKQVDPAAVEAGKGLGMNRRERLRRVQLPIALPVVMTGVRNAVVILIGIAAIGAFIGAGGLGEPIFTGISEAQTSQIVVATVLLSGLALVVDYGLAVIEQLLRLRNGETLNQRLGTRLCKRVLS
ncbi:ABC transporter permease [Natrialbaceae archaeon GCM10025810]|uniref:ABC transporter permease n=1 Tax=Halovalidus salilacus TaxID=3075124 RepID=UPI00361B61EC